MFKKTITALSKSTPTLLKTAAAVACTLGLSTQTLAATTADHDKQIVGYITQWDPWKDGKAGFAAKGAANHLNVDMSKYTILNYSFFGVANDGSLHSGDYRNKNIHQANAVQAPAPLLHEDVYSSWDYYLMFGELDLVHDHTDATAAAGFTAGGRGWVNEAWGLEGAMPIPMPKEGGAPGLIEKAHAEGVKVMASIGGWSMCKHFPEMAADPVKRAKFMEGVRTLMKLGFDGIDLDWEYPGPYSGMNFTGSEADYGNFLTLVKEIRAEIGPDKLITSAFSADTRKLEGFDWTELTQYMDYYNMMTYDFNGGWSNQAGHNSPLYDYSDSEVNFFNWDHLAKWMLSKGIQADKINMGTAFYGRGVVTDGFGSLNAPTIKQDVTIQPDGPISTAADYVNWPLDVYDGTPNYFFIRQQQSNGWTESWDDEAKVPYLSKDGFFVSFDNEESIGLKAQYINDYGLGGSIVWTVHGDQQCLGGTTTHSGKLVECGSLNPTLANKLNDTFANGCQGCPIVRVTSPANGDLNAPGSDILIEVLATDSNGTVASVNVFVDGVSIGTDTTEPFAVNWPAVAEGSYNITAVAVDNEGNSNTSPAVVANVNNDHLAPSVAITAPGSELVMTSLGNVALAATAEYTIGSVTSASFAVDGVAVAASMGANGVYTGNWTATSYGDHVVEFTATSDAGFSKTTSENFTITLCTGEPYVANAVYTGGDEVLYQGKLWRAKWWTQNAAPGTNGVWEEIRDCSNPDEPTDEVPTVTITSPANGSTVEVGDVLTLSATASDDNAVDSVTFYVNGAAVATDSTAPYSTTVTADAIGTLTVGAKSTDDANQSSAMKTVSVTVEDVVVPTGLSVTIDASALTVKEGESVTFSADAVDTNGTVTDVVFSLDGVAQSTDATAPYGATIAFATKGTYSVTATATDNDNNTAVANVNITVESDVIVEDCAAPAWEAGKVYASSVTVSHEGRDFQNKWWTQGENPNGGLTNEWHVWTDKGVCAK